MMVLKMPMMMADDAHDGDGDGDDGDVGIRPRCMKMVHEEGSMLYGGGI